MHRYDADTERLARAITAHALERFRLQQPLHGALTFEALTEMAGDTITEEGLGGEKAFRLWTDVLSTANVTVDHPRYLAFIPHAPTEAASLFDLVVSAESPYGGSWLEGSGAVYAENQALRWLSDLAGMPAEAGGCFVQGGSIGNLSALVAARHAARERLGGARGLPRWSVAVTEGTHASVTYAVREVLDAEVLAVPGDDRGRLTGPALEAALAQRNPEHVRGVFAVVATAGQTNTGVIDDLAGVAQVCRGRGIWMHVDGAYGGAAMAAPSVRPRFAGIEQADSLIVDPHKWLFAPYDSCALIYRQPEVARRAHTQRAAYLEPVTGRGQWNPSDYAVHLSRRARGLPLWFSLAMHGTQKYAAAVEATMQTARRAAAEIRSRDYLRLLVEPDLSILIFERLGWQARDYDQWSRHLIGSGYAFITPSAHLGRPCTRFAIVNPRTTMDDIVGILGSMA